MQLSSQSNQQLDSNIKNSLLRQIKQLFLKHKVNTSVQVNDEAIQILESIKQAREEWLEANRNFEYANGQASIDYYTYKIKACEVRYQAFLKKAKEQGIKLDVFPEVGIYSNAPGESVSAK